MSTPLTRNTIAVYRLFFKRRLQLMQDDAIRRHRNKKTSSIYYALHPPP